MPHLVGLRPPALRLKVDEGEPRRLEDVVRAGRAPAFESARFDQADKFREPDVPRIPPGSFENVFRSTHTRDDTTGDISLANFRREIYSVTANFNALASPACSTRCEGIPPRAVHGSTQT